MKRRILVVSDLHLGGAPAVEGNVGFQSCPLDGQKRLPDFFDWSAAQAKADASGRYHLVLNGDIVDFLAEPDQNGVFSAPTTSQELACRKLNAVFEIAWDALARYVAAGASLILLLGDHDVELTLPRVRAATLQQLLPAWSSCYASPRHHDG